MKTITFTSKEDLLNWLDTISYNLIKCSEKTNFGKENMLIKRFFDEGVRKYILFWENCEKCHNLLCFWANFENYGF